MSAFYHSLSTKMWTFSNGARLLSSSPRHSESIFERTRKCPPPRSFVLELLQSFRHYAYVEVQSQSQRCILTPKNVRRTSNYLSRYQTTSLKTAWECLGLLNNSIYFIPRCWLYLFPYTFHTFQGLGEHNYENPIKRSTYNIENV